MSPEQIALEHVAWLRSQGHSVASAWRQAADCLDRAGLSLPRVIDGWDDVVWAFARAWDGLSQGYEVAA